MSKMDIYSQYISRQQQLSENSLISGQKIISERDVLINRLMAEGFTSKQIDNLLNNYEINEGVPGIAAVAGKSLANGSKPSRQFATDRPAAPDTGNGAAGSGSTGIGSTVLQSKKLFGSYALKNSTKMTTPIGNPDPNDRDNIPPTPTLPGSSGKPTSPEETPQAKPAAATGKQSASDSKPDSERATAGLGPGSVVDDNLHLTAKGIEYVDRKEAQQNKDKWKQDVFAR